jgi:hypothetical protein
VLLILCVSHTSDLSGREKDWSSRCTISTNEDLSKGSICEVYMSSFDENPEEGIRLDPQYTNYLKIGHNSFEFLLDFGLQTPEEDKALFHTRIIASPNCAKYLLELLRQSIDQYEESFGPLEATGSIKEP